MRIGLFIEGELTIGGGFQQELSTAVLFSNFARERLQIVVITDKIENIRILREHALSAELFHPRFNPFIEELIWSNRILHRFCRKAGFFKVTQIERFCALNKIDIIYFLSTSSHALLLRNTPYLITVWDLCHRDHPEFPEIRNSDRFTVRERVLKNTLPMASAIIVDSTLGKKNVCLRYGINTDKVDIVPFQPSIQAVISDSEYRENFIDIKQKYGIDGDYIYYPAQFWAHKNHVYILEGIKILKEVHGKKIVALFSGSNRGNLDFIFERARELGVEKQVKYIGFVDGKEIPYLYRQALALVMPTFFGPTNIPPLEAFANDCPVLYSDLEGMREQTEGAVLLMDLSDPNSMVHHLLRVIEGGIEIQLLKDKGHEILQKSSASNIWSLHERIFNKMETKLKTWKT